MSFTKTLLLIFAFGGTSAVIASIFMPGMADKRVRYALEDRYAIEAQVGSAPRLRLQPPVTYRLIDGHIVAEIDGRLVHFPERACQIMDLDAWSCLREDDRGPGKVEFGYRGGKYYEVPLDAQGRPGTPRSAHADVSRFQYLWVACQWQWHESGPEALLSCPTTLLAGP